MMNYWYEISTEKWHDHLLHKAEIYCGSDILLMTDGYKDSEKCQIAAEYFIQGIKFARGDLS